MMDDDCKRERLGLKAQTRIPMRKKELRFAYVRYALACRDVTNRAPALSEVLLITRGPIC